MSLVYLSWQKRGTRAELGAAKYTILVKVHNEIRR